MQHETLKEIGRYICETNISQGLSLILELNNLSNKDSNNIEYIKDPCSPQKFLGILCLCNSTLCEIQTIALSYGHLKGFIPSSIGQSILS